MGVWQTLQGELAVATGHEFERRVLPLMRFFRVDMIRVPERAGLDQAGIDILAWSDGRHFPWVVQCKGFKEHEELRVSQTEQILKSIQAFGDSTFGCDNYVLVHNRTSENRRAAETINKALSELVDQGKAKAAYLWDRQTLIKQARARLRALILERIREDAGRLLLAQQRLFRFGDVYNPDVPVTSRNLEFEPNLDLLPGTRGSHRVAELLVSPSEARWTMLTGLAGTGKTTSVLHAATLTGYDVIYVRAEAMTERHATEGTNAVFGRLVDAMALFDDFDDETRALAARLAGKTLAGVLKGQETNFALIIDGLDESRLYGRAQGIRQLTNELSEMRCPIVLTTRKEHLDATLSNFETLFRNVSTKGAGKRGLRFLNLELWSNKEVDAFLESAMRKAAKDDVPKLVRFRDALKSGDADSFYGGLHQHPLFLQMILEEVVDGQLGQRNRAQLIRKWIERKIARDVRVGRPLPGDMVDEGTFVETMMVLQERVAAEMTVRSPAGPSLSEHADSKIVVRVARELFENPRVDISDILGCSVLSPLSVRRRGEMPIKFMLRVFHEFSLAAHLRRLDLEPLDYPDAVVALWEELAEE